MASSLLSNFLYTHPSTSNNDTTGRETTATAALTDREKQEILSLLLATTRCVGEGTCDAVVYQTMAALHRYTALCAGLLPPETRVVATNAPEEPQRHPAFVVPRQHKPQEPSSSEGESHRSDHEDALAYGWLEELSPEEDEAVKVSWNPVLALLVQQEQDDEPCLWITREVLASNHHEDDEDSDPSPQDEAEHRDDQNHQRGSSPPATELETLHSIPLRRRLRSCRYQNFYGDHRVVLELKRAGRGGMAPHRRSFPKRKVAREASAPQQIVLRCPSAASARAWVECLAKAKKKSRTQADANIELEMIESSELLRSTSSMCESGEDGSHHSSRRRLRRHTRIAVNVIDSEDDDDEDYGIPEDCSEFDPSLSPTTSKPLAEQLQEAEDRKRAQKMAEREAQALERRQQKKQEEAERLEQERLEAEEAERLRREAMEREREEAARQEERERLETERREKQEREARERKKEEQKQNERLAAIEKGVESIQKMQASSATGTPAATEAAAKPSKPKPMTAAEKQQQRMEREIAARKRAEEERRRIEIEYEQKKKERVEQRRRDLEAQRKAAREEQKRKEKIQRQKFLESEQKKEAMKAAAMKAVPKKVVSGVFSTKKAGADAGSKDSSKDATAQKGNLWFSLGKEMSAFEAADEERKRKEAEKREEEKAKAAAKEKEEDPEQVRKRIAEEARQRLVQEEAGKRREEAEALKKKQAEAAKLNSGFRQQPGQPMQNGWAAKQQPGNTSPHVTSSPQGATISPTTTQYDSVSPQPPLHNHQQPSVASNSKPSIPPLQHAHTQSWNKMQQPPHPSQQAHFQRQQAAGAPGPYYARGYPHQQPSQTPPGSFGNPVHPQYQTQQRQQPHQQHPQPQMHATQPQPAPRPAPPAAPHPTRQHSPNTQPRPAVPQQPQNNEEFIGTELKKSVLIKWGLQPPAMQVLNPVDQLLCSIHGVFPPSFGVPAHEYFKGWKPISRSELVSSSGLLEETKLKKMVRKVRFFLHPDKLPNDLTEEQSFLCKLLWDVINDAFEEYKKSKEDLDWM